MLLGKASKHYPPAARAYEKLEKNLEGSDPLVKLALVGVILVAIYLIMQPSRSARLLGALWFVLP